MTSIGFAANDNKSKHNSLRQRLAVPLGIDLSAWISGISFALGVALAGPPQLLEAMNQTAFVLASYVMFLVIVVAIQRHMRLKATATTFGAPLKLTTTGIFKFTRNPIYLAFLLPLASLAIFSVPASIIAIVFYVAAMTFTVIPREEKELARIFGQPFLDYQAKTRRWI